MTAMPDTKIVSPPLGQLRDGLALIREAIEEHMPVGALEAREYTGVEQLGEIEALVRAVHAIAEKPSRRVPRFIHRDATARRALTRVVCVGRVYKTGGSMLDQPTRGRGTEAATIRS
jgi:hypothetical protein